MLVTFSTKAYADITMFGDAALHLLRLMGHSETVPGALLAEDVAPSLLRLESALKLEMQSPEAEQLAVDANDENTVSLAHRALPLIDLLKAAAKEECNVMWDSGS
jgi:hypothetical protein